MKKRYSCMLCLLLLFAIALCGCGKSDPTKADYGGRTYAELEAESSSLIESISAMDEDTISYYMEQGDDLSTSILSSWSENAKELGEYKGYDGFSVTKSGKTITTDMTVHFEKRDAVFEIAYSTIDMSLPAGAVLNPIQTVGEKMSRAGMNTIISLLIVFTVLILICLIIYCFQLVPYFEQKKKAKEVQESLQDKVVEQIREREEITRASQTDQDTELVAVIAAAIAAFEGTSTDQFVVRSIRRRA